jgi:hypothetical protein
MLAPGAKRLRDERLDLFRGIAMLIIFIAHVPGNSWNDWIPARFGFSSAAELFVFCSGFASALAFGSVFIRRGWQIGTARILYRVWQIYWAQIGLVVALITLPAALDFAFGRADLAAQFGPLLADPTRAILGLATLTWQPDYLDILPMYLVILALVPVVMGLRTLHPCLPFAAVGLLYVLTRVEGFNLPGSPWADTGWFLNPFAWQAIFFIGFFVAMKWLPVPRLRKPWLVRACVAFLVLSVPLSFWGILDHWPSAQALRDFLLSPGSEKTNLHPLRILHLLALAYVALSLIEPIRARLDVGPGHLIIVIGRQSLACFLASLVLGRLAATLIDMTGANELVVAAANITGFAALLATAQIVGWFKSAPWQGGREAPPTVPHRLESVTASISYSARLREAD